VARTGFDPRATERARGRLAGVSWQGAMLSGREMLRPAEKHYLWHVVRNGEWPVGTTLVDYLTSVRQVIIDRTSGIFINRYQGELSLGFIRESRELRGPGGQEWILVQYRVSRGHWITAFQPNKGLAELGESGWSDIQWLQRPERTERH
jgi:hypothetical protein